MVKPATPLSVLLFVAFVLLLLSVLSTPIIKGIPLASFQNVDYGVFGFCKKGGPCSGIEIGYNTADDSKDFTLPANTRHSLSSILIVHPIATLLTFVCFILAVTSHFHSPSHSARYLLILIILLLPTLLITLLAFLVDILLFVPHLQWGGWIVLASTILITASGVVTCAMRRTLVSRKARKKRIAENAEMNGDNFYQRENAKANAPPPLSQQPTAPMVNGAPGADKLPEYATFASATTRRVSDDDQIPLNEQSSSSRNGTIPGSSDDGLERYGGGNGRGGPGALRGGRGGRYNGPRDEFGNPLPPSGAFSQGTIGSCGEPPLRNQNSNETMNSQASRGSRRGGYPRGGPGRGGPYGGGRGVPYNGRGGPYGGGRGGPNNGFGRGDIPLSAMAVGAGAGALASGAVGHQGQNQQGPPPGYANGYPPNNGPPSGPSNGPSDGRGGFHAYGGPGPYARRQSPGPPGANYPRRQSPGPTSGPGYGGRHQSPGPPSGPSYGARQQSPGPPSGPGYFGGRQPSPGAQNRPEFGRSSPPPPLPINEPSDSSAAIGQAVEMDAIHGSPANTPGYPPQRPQELRESDSDVAGLVSLQQQRATMSSSETPLSPSSAYSSSQNSHAKAVPPLFTDLNDAPQDGSYVPPRTAWGPNSLARQRSPPLANAIAPLPPLHQSPVERISPSQTYASANPVDPNNHARVSSGDIYYEDVDPRFAEDSAVALPHGRQGGQNIPSLLVPGGSNRSPVDPPSHMMQQDQQDQQVPEPGHLNVEPNSSYDSLNRDGTRSPAASDASHFTSVSQRGVNPEWRPPPGPQQVGYAGNASLRRPVQQRDVLLQGNPDFELPGPGPRGGGAYVGIGSGPSSRTRQGGIGFPPGNAL